MTKSICFYDTQLLVDGYLRNEIPYIKQNLLIYSNMIQKYWVQITPDIPKYIPNKNPLISIGIDLGTTYSCVGIWNHKTNTVEIIPNELGQRTTPSCVAFNGHKKLVGNSAKNQKGLNVQNTIYDVKTLIGRKYNDNSIQNYIKLLPFKVIRGKQNEVVIEVENKREKKRFFVEEITGMILEHLKNISENSIGKPVTNAVLSVPAYFNDAQRQATKNAAKMAGLNVMKIINEPIAAAIAYGLDRDDGYYDDIKRNVLVFDLGGTTLDVSVLIIDDGVYEIKATAGNSHLGGRDFDNMLLKYCINEFKKKNKVDITKNKKALGRVRTQCEKAKKILSKSSKVNIEIDSLYNNIDFSAYITRAKFENLCMSLFKKCLISVTKALNDAKMKKSEIHDIVIVGGSTKIPKIQEIIKAYFNGKEPCKGKNSDEAVAFGCAIQSAILSGCNMGNTDDILCLDVTPLSLGIETVGGIMTKIIERNRTIPCKSTKIFTTYEDNQPGMNIKIYEGERSLIKDNHLLGKFDLMGIEPAPKGVPQIEIIFDLHPDYVLNIQAKNTKDPSKSNNITFGAGNSRFTADEINNIVKDAEKAMKDDELKREFIEARNKLESTIYHCKNILNDNNAIKQNDRNKLDNLIKVFLSWMDYNPNVTKYEYINKQNEFNKKSNLILKIYDPIKTFSFGNKTKDDDTCMGPQVGEVD